MSISQTNLAWDTLLELGEGNGGPLHDRLRRALRAAIRSGRLPTGSALPPSRKLATDLACSRWVVTEAYSQLVAEGYLEARTGSATRVRWSDRPRPGRPLRPGPSGRQLQFDLAPGLPDLRGFPRRRWAAAIRAEAERLPFTELGYPSAGGHPRLRQVLAGYLQRVRGAVASANDLTIATGVTDGVTRVCRVLGAAGITTVGIEEPGWPKLRQAARSVGLATVPVRVDSAGLRVDDLAAHLDIRAMIIAPAHQFPTGSVLSPVRRAALIEWARGVDGVVIEDDYDAEFRYDRRPVGTVQGMDPSRVVLLGSLSKTLAPALGIGWIVAPPRWTASLRAAAPPTAGPPVLDQLAFATLIESGAYDRHLRSARHRYRARRDALVRALARELPECRISGAAAGLHLLLDLGGVADPAAVVRAAAVRGVDVMDLDAYRAVLDSGPPGLVIGYGNLSDHHVDEAVTHLATAVRKEGR